ncbi:hypothetical protein [Bradyrhizobium sp. CCBAU 65884]|uniref:hypothetical protein n=1 Tax=Bradyrhizobium sp. CCBAU 65884 TaxID=722477 RepID=UPI0023065CBB|nr:hypothetical protein [Bradyrhizobium sp. CCBAU 65884]
MKALLIVGAVEVSGHVTRRHCQREALSLLRAANFTASLREQHKLAAGISSRKNPRHNY